MLPDFEHHVSLPAPRTLAAATHVLVVLTLKDGVDSLPFGDALTRVLRRRRKTLEDLMKTPLSAEVPGGVCSWVVHDPAAAPFARFTALRKAVQSLLGEQPRTLTIVNRTGDAEVGEAAAYIARANGNANGHPLQLVLVELPARFVCVPTVVLNANTGSTQLCL